MATGLSCTVKKRVMTAIFDNGQPVGSQIEGRFRMQPAIGYIYIIFISLSAILAFPGRSYALATAAQALGGGARLYLRLETPVSTKTSHLNQAVSTRVVRQVGCDQGIVIPLGSQVTGTTEK